MYYGLPAAGITCIALLKDTFMAANGPISQSRVLQDLNVLVAEVEVGSLVQSKDPSYALLTTATKTIRTLLNRLVTSDMRNSKNELELGDMTLSMSEEDWNFGASHDFCDFEMDFWLNLAEHPILAIHEIDGQRDV